MFVKTLSLHLLLLFMYASKREIFIFFNQDGVTIKNRQLAELEKDKAGLQNRDVVTQIFKAETARNKVEKYHIDASKPFTIILIGKDGGEKLRLDSVLTTAKLFATIDAMPMRKREMEDK